MATGGFQNQIQAWTAQTMQGVDRIRRASILELFTLVIYATPVDTGRLRGNWQTTVGQPASGVKTATDANGSVAIAEVMANMGSLTDAVWFVNNLPYAERIEYDGWSRYKAPEGMVRRNVIRWQEIVAAKAAAYRG